MAYKAIVLDLDGTTLNEFNTVNETLKDYLLELRKRGLLIFIATGRTAKEVKDVLPPELQVDAMVTANGMSAFIGEKQIAGHALPPELVEELVEKASAEKLYYEVHPNEGARMSLLKDQPYIMETPVEPKPSSVEENEWLSRQAAVQGKIDWREQLETKNIAKIYFFSREKKAMEQWKQTLEKIKNRTAFTMASSTHHNVEVTVEGVSKATGVNLLLEKFELKQNEILAIGDGENDLPLFALAGHAVAMKNATEFVQKQANEVTGYSYKEDGLYHFLKKTFY